MLHAVLEALPAGRWTTYGDLAEVVGTAAQPLGQHVTSCRQCVNVHRVTTTDGAISPGFSWADPADDRRPVDVLRGEGVTFPDERADPAARLFADDLAGLVAP